MRIIIVESSDQVAEVACSIIVERLEACPEMVLGLATGSTPVATYRKLIDRAKEGRVDFSKALTFNLDEYVGLSSSDPNSYRTFMQNHLFDHINIDPHHTHLPVGDAVDLRRECENYESQIRQAGGIDLQLLGIGTDGHIAFNEPGSSLGSRTRVMMLAKQTILDNARFFGTEDLVPRAAITMGIGTILEAKEILILATGSSKAKAVQQMVEGAVTSRLPASALQLHSNVTVVLDSAASHGLEQREYYLEFEQLRRKLGV